MERREFNGALLLAALGLASGASQALDVGALSDRDATAGLRAALERGAASAVDGLGRKDGFWQNPRVKIPLPGWIEKSRSLLRLAGQEQRIDELSLAMNRAAEAAVPQARTLLVQAAHRMTVEDARKILTGGDTSVTQYFAGQTRAPLARRFLPVVTQATEKVGAARKYNALAARGASLGLLKSEDATIQNHITQKALDGLFLMIGDEEKRIRHDPVGTGSAILKKVFGGL